MSNTETKTVGELAVEMPGATRVFERMGIDYCCGGSKALSDACTAKGIDVDAVLSALTEASASAYQQPDGHDWRGEPLNKLTAHIVERYHTFDRDEIARIEPLLAKVCSVYRESHPELLEIQKAFSGLSQDLLMHMMKEEQILFPYINQLQEAADRATPKPMPFFGTVRNPVRMMMSEHDTAGDLLKLMRELSSNYTAPPEACISYRTLYQALDEFERDLHEHIHLENNLLFPRAIEMEE
jgi:regulator of cell morphogenesis and NO signaling